MSKSKEKVCIFIDDSNLFIEGMKYLAKQLQLVVKQDHRFRIEFRQMIEILAKKRSILCTKLYGSVSLSNESVWKAMKDDGIQARFFVRNYKGMEKEVDATLTADMVDEAACLRFQSPHLKPGSVTFIIVSGDRDYLQALHKVHKHGWKLEVVGWETAISKRVKDFISASKCKGAKLMTLDDLILENPSIYFVESRWPSQSEGEHPCFVFEYASPQKEDDARRLSFQVVNLIKRPCQYLRPDNDPKIVKIILLVGYRNQYYVDKDELNMIIAFQNGSCHRVSFESSNDIDSNELKEEEDDDDDDDDDVGGVEERCIYKFSCHSGNRCHCRHTRVEREHFEVNRCHLGAKYKSRMCRDAQARRCAFMSSPRKCPWAHGLIDARCYYCDTGGLVGDHWMHHCPKKNHRHQQQQLQQQPKQQINDRNRPALMESNVILQKLILSDESESDSPSQTDDYESNSFVLSDDSECETVILNDESE